MRKLFRILPKVLVLQLAFVQTFKTYSCAGFSLNQGIWERFEVPTSLWGFFLFFQGLRPTVILPEVYPIVLCCVSSFPSIFITLLAFFYRGRNRELGCRCFMHVQATVSKCKGRVEPDFSLCYSTSGSDVCKSDKEQEIGKVFWGGQGHLDTKDGPATPSHLSLQVLQATRSFPGRWTSRLTVDEFVPMALIFPAFWSSV